jgi:hypothetical protein
MGVILNCEAIAPWEGVRRDFEVHPFIKPPGGFHGEGCKKIRIKN